MNMEQLQKENDELMAYIEQLREVLLRYAGEFRIGKQAEQVLMKTPAKSLRHIESRVEEETIERCVSRLQKLYHIDYEDRNFFISGIEMLPRKYKEQSDEF